MPTLPSSFGQPPAQALDCASIPEYSRPSRKQTTSFCFVSTSLKSYQDHAACVGSFIVPQNSIKHSLCIPEQSSGNKKGQHMLAFEVLRAVLLREEASFFHEVTVGCFSLAEPGFEV
ncbi:hypothetical protein Q8A64_10725, partial [Oxalobacteraceae bacterium R-40]|nr:hypothetical protein [Oxalobacteraceae bacterium R-40]